MISRGDRLLFFAQKHAAALYAQAADFNKTARFYYMKAQDAYYLANAQVQFVFTFRLTFWTPLTSNLLVF